MKKVHLRYQNPDGTSKDWIAEVVGNKLRVHFGKTGKRMQMRETPASQCADGNPLNELSLRMDKKIAKGYEEVNSSATEPQIAPQAQRQEKASSSVIEALQQLKNQRGPLWF